MPKVAFGRLVQQQAQASMAMAVEVHHALVDGLHVGQLVQRLEAWLRDPAPLLL